MLQKHMPRCHKHATQELCGFLGLEPSDYVEMVKNGEPARQMLPAMYTQSWFQEMMVGGNNPAPAAVAPRLMDAILLDGHVGVILQTGLALIKGQERALLKLRGDEFAKALKAVPTQCRGRIDEVMERAHDYPVAVSWLKTVVRVSSEPTAPRVADDI